MRSSRGAVGHAGRAKPDDMPGGLHERRALAADQCFRRFPHRCLAHCSKSKRVHLITRRCVCLLNIRMVRSESAERTRAGSAASAAGNAARAAPPDDGTKQRAGTAAAQSPAHKQKG